MASSSAAVIIPVWNGREHLARCLDALLAQHYTPAEIIAVDNASTDGSAELIAARYPAVTLLHQSRNLGFAGACNVGMRHATADVRVLLNQDTAVERGWLEALVEALERDPACGLAGSKAFYPDGTLQHAGARLDPHVGGQHLGVGQVDDGSFDAPHALDFLSGVALAISAPAYAAVDGLDEGFAGAYFEDVDWCYRVREAGFKLCFVSDAQLVHFEESRAAAGAPAAIYGFQRNRLRLLLKHWPLSHLRDDFVPAEQAWLAGGHSADFVAAVQRAYTHQMLQLGDPMSFRRAHLGDEAGTADELLELLVALRSSTIQRSSSDVLGGRLAAPPALPHSDVPLLGGLIDWLRLMWSRIGADPQVYAQLAQQQEINLALRAELAELAQESQRLNREMIELAGESARELNRLRTELAATQAVAPEQ